LASIYFIGHVSVDHVENPNGARIQPGGAALYSAVAARTLFNSVFILSAVGKDYRFSDVLEPFLTNHLRFFNMLSTSFHIRYDEKWNAHYLKADFGSGFRISPSTIPFGIFQPDDAVHLCPIQPTKAYAIVERIKDASPETQVSASTWLDYMNLGKNRKILRELAARADYFILNDSEAKALTESSSLSTAIRILKAKTLVVTLGELGAIIRKENGEIQMVPALNYPIRKVVDTTGAGDTWCGAFVGAYKLTKDLMKSITSASVISSIKCAGWGFSSLWDLKFNCVDDVIEYVIGLKEGSLQKRISDYTER